MTAAMKLEKGQKFGRLEVIEQAPSRNGVTYWKMRCECGTEKEILGSSLTRTNKPTQSCGCKAIEDAKERATRHGMSRSLTHNSWEAFRTRCNTNHPRYGGRGIGYDPAWDSFEQFLADMGPRPEGTSLERIDNDGDYCKENCMWASRVAQANNTSTNRKLTYNGETMNTAQWARKLGIPAKTIESRLVRGIPVEKALSVPVRPVAEQNKLFEFNGEEKTLIEWAKTYDMTRNTLESRLRSGQTLEEALTQKVVKKNALIEFRGEALTQQQWADKLGMSIKTLRNRFHLGFTVEQALTRPVGRGLR